MIKLILKSFWSATYIRLPAPLLVENAGVVYTVTGGGGGGGGGDVTSLPPTTTTLFVAFLLSTRHILAHPVPTEGAPADNDGRLRWPWWKIKKVGVVWCGVVWCGVVER